MGDRALVIFKDSKGHLPNAYLHWAGENVPSHLEKLKVIMVSHPDDAARALACFLDIVAKEHPESFSTGGIGLMPRVREAILKGDHALIDSFSYGQSGIFVVDTWDCTWRAYSGCTLS